MADQAQLIAQIRFAIEQLSEQNAQHEWEHLCRHLARARICANILPATGPVQAGGDQGRDFETFRTFLAGSALKGRSFVGLASEKSLAFACTLEKAIPAKVRRDVTTIMSSGTSIEGIYVFCSRGLVSSKNHELKQWAHDTHNVDLEILDGAAISELLGDREIFWIAERYLQIPAELLSALPVEEEQDWYSKTLNKWRHEKRPAQTFAEFSEIRAAARDALGEPVYDSKGVPIVQHERPELPFWIDRLDEIASQDSVGLLHRRAFYEASVLRFKGLGSLIGQEDFLRHYFAQVPQLQDASDLEDANTLLTYILFANKMHEVELEDSEVDAWYWALEQQLDARIREAKKLDKLNERCALLEVRGHMALFSQRAQGVLNVGETLNYWSKLARIAAHAPLFPLERFADRLAQYARFIGAHPDYEPLTEAVDALVSERFGSFKTAEKCLTRAEAFHKAGDLPRAMDQLHRAKIDWFAEETLGQSLLALHWLSAGYEEQGLYFAAKYYALSGAYIALYADDLRLKFLIARSLEQAAEKDYAVGAWHGFLELAEAAAIFYPHFARDPDADFNDPDGLLQHLLFYLPVLPVATKKFHPNLESFAQQKAIDVAERLNLVDVFNEVQPTAKDTWAEMDAQASQQTIEEQLAGPPWSDAGLTRRTQWVAYGVTWNVEWSNDYETTLAAEEFLASLQIFLSDLANQDLCFIRSTVEATIQLAPANDDSKSVTSSGFDTRFDSSNTQHRAFITLPSYQRFRDGSLSQQELNVGTLSVASSLLCEVSLLPYKRFYEILNDRFSQGLQDKLLIGAHYSQCLSEFISEETFNKSQRKNKPPIVLSTPFTSQIPEALGWVDSPGPGYAKEAASKHIKNRYDGFALPIGITLGSLVQEPNFQQVVSGLRADGWKDWHILSAVFHVTMNHRINHRSVLLPSMEAEQAVSNRMIREPESESAPLIPLGEFSEEKLRDTMPIYMVSCLRTYDLEIHQLTPDFEGVEEFLTRRYNFWTDDIEHEDPFTNEQS